MKRITIFWILSLLITLATALFQRMTGPTQPKKVHFTVGGNEYHTKLPRSITNGDGCSVITFTIQGLPDEVTPGVLMRKYKSADAWTLAMAVRTGDRFAVTLPALPAAAKMEYGLSFANMTMNQNDIVVVRCKEPVSAWLLIPHILLMFAAMLLSNLAGLLALFRRERYRGFAKMAVACLVLGGIVLGSFVQKSAFGSYWTGFPLGNDLTDTKTLVVLIVWAVALIPNWRQNRRPVWVALAAAFMLAVYCIPHSTAGSEYDYETGVVKTGMG